MVVVGGPGDHQGVPEAERLLLGVSTAFVPVAETEPNDVLRYGVAGHIFLGWIPLG